MSKAQTRKKRRYLIVNSVLMILVLAITAVGNSVALKWDGALSIYLGTVGDGGAEEVSTDTNYFSSDYGSEEELKSAQEALAEQIVGEGTVLLKNDGALPLASAGKVSLFGIGSAEAQSGGSGSGEVKGDKLNLQSALEAAGFELNPVLRDFYAASSHQHGNGAAPGGGSAAGDWKIDEVPQSEYTAEIKASYEEYSDAAIVVFSRQGGEGGDLPTEMSRFGNDADKHYLELSTEEQELLKAIHDSGAFDKTIVIINSAGAMELGFVDEEAYGVDACLWYSGTGTTGINAVADIFTGEVNPSGRLVDTYAYDNFSAPSMQNFGDFRYVDSTGNLLDYSYVNYAENIYVGYRYYETRYEDVVTGAQNAGDYDYAATVKYPFGYGLSYTDFEWSDFGLTEAEGKYTASVTVTNSGSTAGKDSVQIYVQAPYIAGGAEKSAVVLAGFAKTKNLEPGESQQVEVTFDREDIASYDENTEKTFILDAGRYYVTAGKNAHDGLNNILAAKGYTTKDGMTENGNADLTQSFELAELVRLNTAVTGAEITNQFDNAQAEDAVYLSRSDWSALDNGEIRYATGSKSGVSEVMDASGTAGTAELSDELLNALKNGGLDSADLDALASGDYPDSSAYTYDSGGRLGIVDLLGKEYDDPEWDELLNQMKLSEMHTLLNSSGYGTAVIESISKPKTYEYDGPAGISNFITGAGAFGYPSAIMVSSTWNTELVEEMGKLVGEDGIKTKTSGWYAPAVNIHRTPFSGRNYEYYSEDPLLAGKIAASEIQGVQSKGVYVYMKHFALNDQETNRAAYGSVATWSNEQAIREIYLKPFQLGVEEGGAKGIMTALNRIGTTRAMSCANLLTNVARGEWGFDGIFITDYESGLSTADVDRFLAAGGNLILTTTSLPLTDAKQNWCRAYLREGTHRVLYQVANSLAMNGLESGAALKAGFPVYKILLIALDAIVAIGVLLAAYFTFRTLNMSEEEFAARRVKSRKRRIIIWSSVGVIFIVLLVLFWIFLWPILADALLM